VENPVNHESLGRFFKVDPVFAGAVSVQSTVGTTDCSKPVGMLLKEIGGEDVEFAQDFDLERGG
jgi:hypothetical protein